MVLKLTLWKDQTLQVFHIINVEIEKLLQKGVIIKCEREDNDLVSTVFIKEKKYGSFRTILNLKCLIKIVKYKHFKMVSLKDVFKVSEYP